MTSPRRRRSGVRQSALIASLLLALVPVAAGCGAEDEPAGDHASDPAGHESSEPTPTLPTESTEPAEPTETPAPPADGAGDPVEVTGDAGVTTATLVSATEAGGRVDTLASPLVTQQERTDFAAQLERGLGDSVVKAVEALPQDGSLPYGVVAAIGCDAPTAVSVTAGEAGFEVEAQLPKKTVQCFAPVTYVVVFAAPAA